MLAGPEQATELLAALPDRPDHEMVALRSPLLGPLIHLVWRNRGRLRECCVSVLESAEHDAGSQRAAIRVMAALGAPRLHDLCATLSERGGEQVRPLAAVAPMMVPPLLDRLLYERRLFRSSDGLEQRIAALAVLASVPSGLGALYDRLRRTETYVTHLLALERVFLQLACDAPFAGAVPLIEAYLRSSESEGPGALLGPLACIGRLPDAALDPVLLRAAAHANPSMRATAVLALGRRRSTSNLPRLRELLAVETDPIVSATLATSVLASGARSVAALQDAACSGPVLDFGGACLRRAPATQRLPRNWSLSRWIAMRHGKPAGQQSKRLAPCRLKPRSKECCRSWRNARLWRQTIRSACGRTLYSGACSSKVQRFWCPLSVRAVHHFWKSYPTTSATAERHRSVLVRCRPYLIRPTGYTTLSGAWRARRSERARQTAGQATCSLAAQCHLQSHAAHRPR